MAQGRLLADGVETLRKTVRERGVVDAAQIRLIGLEGMRPPAGADPSGFEASVRLQSLQFLQRHFRAEDVVLSCGDGFLIIYDTSNARDPAKDGEQIQNALNALYQGEDGMHALRVEVSPYRLERRQAIAMEALPAMRRLGDIAYTTAFAPAWSSAHEVVTAFCAAPSYLATGKLHSGYDPHYRAHGRHQDCDFLALDLEILDRAVSNMTQRLDTGERCDMSFTVHSTTLHSSARREIYCEKLALTPERVRRQLCSRIAEIEPGLARAALGEWVSILRMASAHVSVELHASEQRLQGLAAVGVRAAGFNMPPLGTPETMPIAQCHALMKTWRSALDEQSISFFVNNIADQTVFDAACEERVDFLGSEILCPAEETPSDIRSASRASMRARLPRTFEPDIAPGAEENPRNGHSEAQGPARTERSIERRSRDLPWSQTSAPERMIRQLRATCRGLGDSAELDRFLLRLDGAISLAQGQGAVDCAASLVALKALLGRNPGGSVLRTKIVERHLRRTNQWSADSSAATAESVG